MRSLTHASFYAVSATVEGMSRQETPDYCALHRSRYEAVLRHFESLRHTGVCGHHLELGQCGQAFVEERI